MATRTSLTDAEAQRAPECTRTHDDFGKALRHVLWKLAEGWKAKRIEGLTPHAWAKAHATGRPD